MAAKCRALTKCDTKGRFRMSIRPKNGTFYDGTAALNIEADWHVRHEDVVSALDKLRSPETVEVLFRATQWIPKSLEYDDSRALAVKAIWALGKIPGTEAETKLETLARFENTILRQNAVEQLERRRKAA